jgi:rubrerythrin
MPDKKMSNTPLGFALDFEVNGVSLYLKLARKTQNPFGKKLFYTLAAEEIEHAQKIDSVSNEISGLADWGSLSSAKAAGIESSLKEFFGKTEKDELRNNVDNLEGYETAMQMEKKGFEAYTRFFNEATDKKEKEFYKYLIAQEKEHLDALANVYSYLTQTGDWLREEESKVWNWMNM